MDERMETDRRARGRFIIINMLRLVGLAMVLGGIWLAQQPDETQRLIGYFLAGAGVIDVFLVPTVLARAWASPKK